MPILTDLSSVVVVETVSRVHLFVTPVEGSPPGPSVRGISQASILQQVAIASSRGIFLAQGSNPRLLQWQAGSLPLSHL